MLAAESTSATAIPESAVSFRTFRFFSPIARATRELIPTESPAARAMKKKITGKISPVPPTKEGSFKSIRLTHMVSTML